MARNNDRDRRDRDSVPVAPSPISRPAATSRPEPPRVSAPVRSSPVRAADPIRAVSTRPVGDRWAGYNKTADGVQLSLSPGELDTPGRVVAGTNPTMPGQVPSTPGKPDPVRVASKRISSLKIAAPKLKAAIATKAATHTRSTKAVTVVTRATPQKAAGKVNSTNTVSSAPKPRDKMTCKPRPENNKPKGGGGGSMRRFIPWCG